MGKVSRRYNKLTHYLDVTGGVNRELTKLTNQVAEVKAYIVQI